MNRVTPINIDQSIEYLTTLCLQQSRASDHCANQMFQFSHTIEVECFAMSLAIRVFAPALLSVLRQLHLQHLRYGGEVQSPIDLITIPNTIEDPFAVFVVTFFDASHHKVL